MADNIKKDRKQYFKDYFNKNKEELSEKVICDICDGKYMKMSRANHFKTKKHIAGIEIQKLKDDNERMKNIFCDINKKIENI